MITKVGPGKAQSPREALFQQTIKDLEERNKTLSLKASELQLSINGLVAKNSIIKSERDCALIELERLKGKATD